MRAEVMEFYGLTSAANVARFGEFPSTRAGSR